jgi:hypothetical protein
MKDDIAIKLYEINVNAMHKFNGIVLKVNAAYYIMLSYLISARGSGDISEYQFRILALTLIGFCFFIFFAFASKFDNLDEDTEFIADVLGVKFRIHVESTKKLSKMSIIAMIFSALILY